MPERKSRHKRRLWAGFTGLFFMLTVLVSGCVAGAAGEPDVLDPPSPETDSPIIDTTQASQPVSVTVTPQPVSDPGPAASTKEGSPESGSYDDYEEHDDRYTEIEFRGVVSAVDNGVLTVNGQQVIIPTDMNISGLQVGSTIKVEAWLGADGQLTAKEIELEAAPGGGSTMGDDDDDHSDDSGSGQSDDNSGSGDGGSSSDDESESDRHDDGGPDDGEDGGHDEDDND